MSNEPQTEGVLPSDVSERVLREARKDGIFAGLTGGLASAVLGQRVFGFSRNIAIFCGVSSGVLSGYMFSEAFKSTALAKIRAEEARIEAKSKESVDISTGGPSTTLQ